MVRSRSPLLMKNACTLLNGLSCIMKNPFTLINGLSCRSYSGSLLELVCWDRPGRNFFQQPKRCFCYSVHSMHFHFPLHARPNKQTNKQPHQNKKPKQKQNYTLLQAHLRILTWQNKIFSLRKPHNSPKTFIWDSA